MREISLIARAANHRDAYQAWLAASYNAFAHHDPGNMPEAPKLTPIDAGPEFNTVAEMAQVRAWMKSLTEPFDGR